VNVVISLRLAIAFALVCALSLSAAHVLRPTNSLAKANQPIDLKVQIPLAFGGWREVRYLTPVLPDPSLQARLDELYTQVLARTYRHADGRTVMLSIAYGSDQSSEATAVHRPEFCYTAQGFAVANMGEAQLSLGPSDPLNVQRLVARQGSRTEPISYWVTLDRQAVLPGFQRKLTQLQYGLRGDIPDGMLVRVSTLEPGSPMVGFDAQAGFLKDLFEAVDPRVRQRYFGRL
jgi:EpsI family protein